jgi:site-specific recombinase XerD
MALTTTQAPIRIELDLIPQEADKDTTSRLKRFKDWLQDTGQAIHEPNLAAYRDQLLKDLAPASVAAHLATVRGRYKQIIEGNPYRDIVELAIIDAFDREGIDHSIADREAAVNRILQRTRNAINPSLSSVKVPTSQDDPDSKHRRLTADQATALLQAPGIDDLQGLRDTSLIALMLATGIRAAEAAAVEVEDLRRSLGGELALHVKAGKGDKGRLIPYGGMDWVLIIIDAWLKAAGLTEGPVFRGFYAGYTTTRPQGISTRAIQDILNGYPIPINGELVTISPHDLRRTYARLNYEQGMDLISIQQNLGHEDLKTTQGYIGVMDASARRPRAIIRLDLNGLMEGKY